MNEQNEEFLEYDTFTVEDSKGAEIELAVIEDFEFCGKKYVAAARVEGDTISEEGLYLYEVTLDGEEEDYSKIEDADELKKVAEYYMSI